MNDDNHTSKSFNNNSNSPKPPVTNYKPVAQPISKGQIDELHKQLSAPRVVRDHTPIGDVVREVRSERDNRILKEIEEIRRRLESRRGAAKEAFKRAVNNETIKKGRRW